MFLLLGLNGFHRFQFNLWLFLSQMFMNLIAQIQNSYHVWLRFTSKFFWGLIFPPTIYLPLAPLTKQVNFYLFSQFQKGSSLVFLVLRRVWFLGPSYDWSRLAALTPVTAGPLNPSTILTSDILEGHYLPKLVFTGVPLLLLRYMMYLEVVYVLSRISVFGKEEGSSFISSAHHIDQKSSEFLHQNDADK